MYQLKHRCECCTGNIARGVGSRNSYSTRCSRVLHEASRPHPQCYISQYSTSKTGALNGL